MEKNSYTVEEAANKMGCTLQAVREQINCSIILGEINTNTTQFLLPNAHIENIVVPSGIGTGIVKFSDGKHDSNIMPLLTPYYNKRCL